MGAALLAVPGGALAQTYSGVQAFGDSLTDNGNVFALTRRINPIPRSPPYFEGRFSNGPVWVEHLIPRLGLPSTALDDHAFGGAESGSGPSPAPGVLAQVRRVATLGPRPGSRTLVAVWGGSNDYRNRARTTADPAGLVNTTVGNVQESVRLLIAAGAREILVPNIPNLGDTPEGREQDAAAPGTAARINGIVASHNAALAQMLDRLRLPGVRISLMDVNGLFRDVLAAPAKYGFTNTTVPCLLDIAPDVGADSGACATPQAAAGALFFDKIHPTTSAHAMLAQFADATLRGPMAGGSAAPSRTQMALLSTAEQARAISDRLEAVRGGAAAASVMGSGLTPLGGGGAVADRLVGGVSAADRLDLTAPSERPFGVFVYGTHDWGNREARDGQNAFDYRGSLVALGADYRVAPGLVLGGAVGYGSGRSSVSDGGRAEAESWKFSAYAGYSLGGFHAEADVGYSIDRYPEIRRATGFAFLPQARGDTRGNTITAGLSTGYDVPLGGLSIGPFVGGRYTRIHVDGFTEDGASGLNLRVDDSSATSFIGAVGVRLGGVFDVGTAKVAPHVRLAYEHEFSNDPRRATVSLAGVSSTTEPGVGTRNALVAGLGVAVRVSDRVSLVADYASTLVRADGRDHSMLGKVEVKF